MAMLESLNYGMSDRKTGHNYTVVSAQVLGKQHSCNQATFSSAIKFAFPINISTSSKIASFIFLKAMIPMLECLNSGVTC